MFGTITNVNIITQSIVSIHQQSRHYYMQQFTVMSITRYFVPLSTKECPTQESPKLGRQLKGEKIKQLADEIARMKLLAENQCVKRVVYSIQKYKPSPVVLVITVNKHDTNSSALFSKISYITNLPFHHYYYQWTRTSNSYCTTQCTYYTHISTSMTHTCVGFHIYTLYRRRGGRSFEKSMEQEKLRTLIQALLMYQYQHLGFG